LASLFPIPNLPDFQDKTPAARVPVPVFAPFSRSRFEKIVNQTEDKSFLLHPDLTFDIANVKYDDASWHYGGNFPSELPNEAGATHIGMFVAWCMLNGMAGETILQDFPESLENLKLRRETPGAWFIKASDEKFVDDDLNEEGNAFTQFYYDSEKGNYLTDYAEVFGEGLDSLYHVPDTWDSYDKLAPVIQARYEAWKK
jgi:hypothetical protein